MVEVVSTGVSHMCDNSTVSVKKQNLGKTITCTTATCTASQTCTHTVNVQLYIYIII